MAANKSQIAISEITNEFFFKKPKSLFESLWLSTTKDFPQFLQKELSSSIS
jgi:hypothetical protein